MTNIICDSTIEYTKDDDFNVTVVSDSELGTEDKLSLIIAKNETAIPVINNSYSVNSNSEFVMTLSNEDKKKLELGDYIYKLVLTTTNGKIVTQLSGNFIVKWGA